MLRAQHPPPTEVQLELPDAEVRLWPAAFDRQQADALQAALRESIEWQSEEILIFGRRRLVPRLVAWHGDAGAAYKYSGTLHVPRPWTSELAVIKARVEEIARHEFNSVLLNLYRDGRDGMGWHADDEPELGCDPVIASVSFGATRVFKLRHRRHADVVQAIELRHGDLLLMAGTTQRNYVHSIPKTARPMGERINLTFRHVLSSLG